METVQLQCGHCKQIMAIAVEHLGGQVQCPHCRSVVQTPARTTPTPPAPAPKPAVPNMELNPRESIFTGAEATDDVFGSDEKVKVELPSEPPAAVNHPPETLPPPPMFSAPQMEADANADLTRFKPRPIYDKGIIQLSILIFVVPYSILTTLVIIYLLFFHTQNRNDPLQFLPDPSPKKGGPQPVSMQPKHDLPLAASSKTTLKTPLTIGDLTVTPVKVLLTADGDLQLFMRARNDSKKIKFEPVHDSFLRHATSKAGNEPYSFIESNSKSVSNLYGGFLNYYKSFNGKNETPDTYVIGPREEAFIVVTTTKNYRTPQIANIVKSNEGFTWRVQMRRGLVKKKGVDVSATAVFGVEFSASDIEREAN